MKERIITISRGEYIYKNPKTKQGHEAYVRFDMRLKGWVYDFGQAHSVMRVYPTINDAVNEMRDCDVFGKSSIPKGIFKEHIPRCWYCGEIANYHHTETKNYRTVADYWVCEKHSVPGDVKV